MKYGYDIAPAETREAVIKAIDFNSAHSKSILYELIYVIVYSYALLWYMSLACRCLARHYTGNSRLSEVDSRKTNDDHGKPLGFKQKWT
jgi:hypothetical protein